MERPENADLEHALAQLEASRGSGHTFTVVDASGMSERERFAIYSAEAIPATHRKYQIRRAFGSNRHNAEDFGCAVPALIVYERDSDTTGRDVFPHQLKDGQIVTIADGVRRFGLG